MNTELVNGARGPKSDGIYSKLHYGYAGGCERVWVEVVIGLWSDRSALGERTGLQCWEVNESEFIKRCVNIILFPCSGSFLNPDSRNCGPFIINHRRHIIS